LGASEHKAVEQADILSAKGAGGLAIRGGILRVGGYVAGILLLLVAIPFLTRHLGPDGFGRYVTVLSLIAIVAMVSDAGLTVVGVREYAVRDAVRRERLVRNLVGLRAMVAAIGVAGATLFALVAGYSAAMVVGTALAGTGLVLMVVQQAYTVSLQGDLRLGLVTAFDLLRQSLTVVGILALVAADAGLVSFFALSVPVALAVLSFTALAVRRRTVVRPSFDPGEWRFLIRQTLPLAVATSFGAFFYRIAIIMMSLIATAEETGYFSASFRIVEAIIVVPGLVTAAAFPILARAAHDDRDRLVHSMQRLFEVAVILGTWTAVSIVLGAEPAIRFVGGPEFESAVPVLRVQGIALASSFLVAVWAAGLWALHEQRGLAWANGVGVVAAAGLTAALIPGSGALGAAIAMTIAEALLAATYAIVLLRGRPYLRPSLSVVPKALVAAAPALALWFTPLPPIVNVPLGTVFFFAILVALRGLPEGFMSAFVNRKRA
jgi:O-antigen/teichoic acid export membrane protein